MRILELALAGVLVLSVPIAAHANERGLEYCPLIGTGSAAIKRTASAG